MVKLTDQQKVDMREWSRELGRLHKQHYRHLRRLWRLFDEVPNSRVMWSIITKNAEQKAPPSPPTEPHPRCGKMSLEEAEYVSTVKWLEKARRESEKMSRCLEDLFETIPNAGRAWEELKLDEKMAKKREEENKRKKRKIVDSWFNEVMKN